MNELSCVVSRYETIGDHSEFVVQISCGNVNWLISRRFSDFASLDSTFRSSFSHSSGDGGGGGGSSVASSSSLQLPEKQWFGRFDSNFLAKRQADLQTYLAKMLSIPGVLNFKPLQYFLEMDKNIVGVGTQLEDLTSSYSDALGDSSHGQEESNAATLVQSQRMANLVSVTADAFIAVGGGGNLAASEQLDPESALQRRLELFSSTSGFTTDAASILNPLQVIKMLPVLQLPLGIKETIQTSTTSEHETMKNERRIAASSSFVPDPMLQEIETIVREYMAHRVGLITEPSVPLIATLIATSKASSSLVA